MKPFFTLDELSELLDFDDDHHFVADALRAAGVSMIYSGKEADLSGWAKIRPHRNSSGAIVIVRGHLSPPPDQVVVYTESLPESWKQLLAKSDREKEDRARPALSEGSTKNKWPWGSYETELLRHLAAAARDMWNLYDPQDPSTAPTNAQVEEWLKKEKKVSGRTAEIMATILRADDLPKGPRK